MDDTKSYFFCGIGGSGMLPLACILRGKGARVGGSDRSLDQGRVSEKFAFLRRQGIELFPQDGSGVTEADQILVTSAAVEETIPDIVAARQIGARRITRPQLLAQLLNAAPTSIAVAGTSGKSTVTGMVAWILRESNLAPTVMNGAVMKNFVTRDTPSASALVGEGGIFVSEVDESDGSIALYDPNIAVLNNISLDHKSIEELRSLFRDFALRADRVVLNIDDEESRDLAAGIPRAQLVTFSFMDPAADLYSHGVDAGGGNVSFSVVVKATGECRMVRVNLWGTHNAYNAMAAIGAAMTVGVSLERCVASLESFAGLRRRFELVGEKGGVLVVDDFAHNPDKIAATLRAARAYLQGRLLLFFQPHGYGPLRLMKDALVDTFAQGMKANDMLVLCDPVFFGGTVERTVGSGDVVAGVRAAGLAAKHIPNREEGGRHLAGLARPGDRIIIMGARDDTLSQFAADLLERLG